MAQNSERATSGGGAAEPTYEKELSPERVQMVKRFVATALRYDVMYMRILEFLYDEFFSKARDMYHAPEKIARELRMNFFEKLKLKSALKHLEGLGILARSPLDSNAFAFSPDDPVIHQRLAGILSGQWRYGSAIRHAKRAVELAPDDAQARQTLGATYYHAKETEAARTELARALELDPELARAHFTIGLTYQLDGDLARAIDSYRRALGIDPDLAECREELGRAEARLRAERMQGRSTFGCAGTDAGAGSPEALAALMLLAGAPALALRGRMFLIRCVHGDRILQV